MNRCLCIQVGSIVYKRAGTVFRWTGVVVHKRAGITLYWQAGDVVCRCSGVAVSSCRVEAEEEEEEEEGSRAEYRWRSMWSSCR